MIRLRHFLTSIAALAAPSLLWAVPADPRPRVITNPDGSTIEVRMHGDERFHFMTDADCTRILSKNADGFVVDAVRNGTILSFNRENVALLRAEAGADDAGATRSGGNAQQRMGSLNTEGRTKYPTVGNDIHSLVVLVEFQDAEFTIENPKEYYTRQLNEPGFSDYGGCGSAADYFRDASHGLYTPQFDVYGPVKISKKTTYFADSESQTKNMDVMIREALTELHNNGELNLADYDFDEDGTLDTVFIYYAGYGSADSETMTIWPHQSEYWSSTPLKFDGIKVGPYACANELDGYNPETGRFPWADGSTPWVGGIGTFVHEYGHVLGLPDLYDVEYTKGVVTPGQWDVMDQGSYNFNGTCPPLYSAYEQWVCHWLEYTDAEDATHYDLAALGTSDAPTAVRIRIPMSADGSTFQSEYFVLETRSNTSWDSIFPDSGVMAWRINYKKSIWLSNSVNSQAGSNVMIVYANGEKHPIFTEGAIYPGADVELTPSKKYSLWNSPVITSIGYDEASKTGSFDYNMAVQSDIATVLHDNPEALADGSRAFVLEWDPVEGADSYQVTVWTSSNHKIVADLNNTNVGDVTSIVVGPMSSVYWKLEMEAFVRCVVDGMPSKTISNVVTFKPSELPKQGGNVAVEGIDADNVLISGGVGVVNAPEDAVIYNMSGQQLRNENLAPGIYLVSYRGATRKVLVR